MGREAGSTGGLPGLGRTCVAVLGVVAVLALVAASATPARAAGPELPDLAHVTLTPADLPPGFEVSEDRAESFTSLAHVLAGSLDSSPDATDHNAVVLQRTVDGGAEFVTSVLVGPLGEADEAAFDATVQQSSQLVREAMGDMFGDATVTAIGDMRTGVSRFALAISAPDAGVEYRAVAARRGAMLEVIGHAWTEGVTPVTSLATVAGIVDARLAAVVGTEAPVYRPTGPLVPELTTHIPSPLDVSTDPAVVGTNVVLAAVALLLLTISSKLATQMIDDHEATLTQRIGVLGAMGRLEARAGAAMAARVRRPRLREATAFLGVTLFYGVVFSLLEPGWVPWSVTGLWLLLSFTVASAVVGMADDLVAWRVARRWDVPAALAVRPTSALVALGSVGLSRLAAVVPGLMFGTPDALRLDEEALGVGRARRLAVAGIVTLVAIATASWAATIVTTGMARAGELVALLAGVEALLLLVFASALQNLFVALMGLRGSAGELLRARSPVTWAVALGGVGFLFFHTLLNPQGDPAAALANRNVQVIFGLVGVFSAVTFATWGLLRLGATATEPAAMPAEPVTPAAMPAEPVTDAFQLPASAAPVAAPSPVVAGWVAGSGVAVGAVRPAPAGRSFEASIGTADGSARGRATFRLVDGWIVARTQLVDPGARRQLRAFVVLSAAAWMVPFLAFALAVEGPVTDAFVAGFLVTGAAWLAAVVIARLWLERYAVAHTAVFPAGAIVATGGVGRDWNLGCALSILLTPLIGLLYLLLGGGRVIRVVAPLRADRPDPVTIRLKGSEAEARFLEQLLLAARLSG